MSGYSEFDQALDDYYDYYDYYDWLSTEVPGVLLNGEPLTEYDILMMED